MSENQQPFEKPHDSAPKRFWNWATELNFRVQTILLTAAALLFAGAITVVLSALVVNQMKNELVSMAEENAKNLGNEARREIERALRAKDASSLNEILQDPEVRTSFRLMTRDGAVVLAAMVDSEGNCIYQQFGDETLVRRSHTNAGGELEGRVPGTDDLTWALEVHDYPEGVTPERIPIEHQGKTLGFVEYGISEEEAIGNLERISHHISVGLTYMVAVVVLFLSATVFLLYRVANRHLALQKRHDDAQHLAQIGTMASGLAHEIRNPLHAMNLHLEAAMDDLEAGGDGSVDHANHILDGVKRQISSLSHVLTNFMNYALPSRLETEPVRLGALITETADLLAPEFSRRNATFYADVPQDAWIEADPSTMRQVFINILMNAAQAVENSSTREITVKTESRGSDTWLVSIEDTGAGFPPGQEEDIFDVFVSHRKGGSGFGLAIAKRIVEEHGGKILAENRREGGARIWMQFQATKEPSGYTARAQRNVDENGVPTVIG
ncbi:GHKL domain-containing protein [bacterium]|nr:GHKL domain-containing protein [bacterium]